MKLTTKSKGLDSCERMMQSMSAMTDITGAYLAADNREENPSIHNGDVIQFLAGNDKEGRPSGNHRGPIRNILPTKADSDAAAKKYLDRMENRLKVLGSKSTWKQYKGLKQISAQDKKAAHQAAASGLRLAMQHLSSVMADRVESNNYEKVSENYAAWREKKYSIPHNIVLRASGQLLANLKGARVRIVTNKSSGILGRIGLGSI